MNKITLKANFETGEGDVGNLEKWRNVPALMRADLLKDWLVELEGEYNLALQQAFHNGEIQVEADNGSRV